MKRIASLVWTLLLAAATLSAQTLPELFQKAKAQVKGESWADAMKTLDALEAESVKSGNETAHQQLLAPTAFYRAVCEANLGQTEKATMDFETFLTLQPNASLDPSIYSAKTVAVFEAAKRNQAPASDPAAEAGGPGSMFSKFQEFKAPPNSSEPVNDAWAEGPIRWIITPEERRSWAALFSPGERQEFVDRFWEARNPRSGSPDNISRTTFDRRVAYADANFVQAEGTRGSLTDRGMVFVLLGPPGYVGRRPIRTGEDPNEAEGMSTTGSQDISNALRIARSEGKLTAGRAASAADKLGGPGARAADASANWREIWHYRKELLPKGVHFSQVDVEFVTKSGYGVNVLQRTTQTNATLDASHVRPVRD